MSHFVPEQTRDTYARERTLSNVQNGVDSKKISDVVEINMEHVALEEAATRLAELIGLAARGEDVVITKEDGSGFKIIPLPNKRPYPKFGSASGLVEMADDFDEPLADFEEYMP